MRRDRAVGGFVLEVAVRRYEHARHHGKRAGGGGDEVAHHVAVVILAGPDDAAGGADHSGDRIVYKAIAVLQAGLLKGGAEFLVENLLEQKLEGLVVILGYGVLGREPQILLHIQRIGKAGSRKGQDGIVPIVHGLQNAGAGKIKYRLAAQLRAVRVGEHKLCLTGAGNAVFRGLVHIAVCVTGNGDGLFPAGDHRLYPRDKYRRAEHRAVERRADGGVGRSPKLFEAVFLLPLVVGRNGRALNADVQALDRLRRLMGHCVLGFVAVRQRQVIVFGVQLNKGAYKLLLYHPPKDMGHLIAVKLGNGNRHFDLFHSYLLFCAA